MKYVISATAILLANFGVFALPQGGRVEAGKGNLDNPAHIIQESQHLQTRWNSFDIGATEQVRIQQPNAQASINIKVSNGAATNINGTLTANGRVSLENPAGIQFGKNSVVNVGGLLASSANGSVTSLGQVSATEAIRFQSLSSESVVNVGGNVAAQEIIVEGNGDIIIGNSAHFTANKQVLIGGGFQGKDSSVLNSRTTDVKAAAQINAPYVVVWSDKKTRFLGRIDAGRGFVEVSGKQSLIFPDISRAKAGDLLLDPNRITIRCCSEGSPAIDRDGEILAAESGAGSFDQLHVTRTSVNNYNGNVFLAASGTLTVNDDAHINKSNGSLTLVANSFQIHGTITISGTDSSGARHYLSFALTGAINATTLGLGSGARINTSDLRIANNYTTSNVEISISTFFAAPGRNVTITAPAHGRVNLGGGFNLCAAGNTGCGDLTVNTGTMRLAGTFVADDINLTVAAGAIDFAGTPTITANSIRLTQVNAFSNTAPAATFSVKPGIARSSGTQAAVDWARDGNALLPKNIIVDAGTDINLADEIVSFFDIVDGVLDLGSSSLSINISGRLTLPDGLIEIVTAGNNITLMVGTLSAPANLSIQTTGSGGDITLQGSYVVANILQLFSSGALNFGTGAETSLSAASVIFHSFAAATASGQKLSLFGGFQVTEGANINVAELVLETSGSLLGTPPTLTASALSVTYTGSGSTALPSWVFGAYSTTLTVPEINIATDTTWAGDSITFTGNTSITGAGALTLNVPTINAGSNNLTINLPSLTLGTSTTMTAANISLTASAGGIDFGTTSTITAPTINLSQTADYATSLPATFSTTPTLTAPVDFTKPSWGVCGANCYEPESLTITDGNLEGAVVGKFNVSSGRLDLGSFNLTSSGVPLVVPANITRIQTGGAISIMGGLTAEGDLRLFTDTMELGGTFTTSTGSLEFGSFDDTLNIGAVGDLTFNSHVIIGSDVSSLRTLGFNLTLDSVDASSASFVLSGNNITLNGAFTATDSVTITAANDLAVNDTITASRDLALTATAGGITFASTSTAITAASIALTQADAYGESVPATFSTPPSLNSPTTSFYKPVAWGVCGTNCTPIVAADLVITDGSLETAIAGKFVVSGGDLDLGNFSLTSSGVPLVVPASITRILLLSGGTISITGGLTASGNLDFFTDTMELGGTFTTTTGGFRFLESDGDVRVMAVADLTFNSPVFMGRLSLSLGSSGFNLTLDSIETQFASFVLSGKNITLNGALTTSASITITADNDLFVNDSITATNALALTATAGGITFTGTPTITASTITLTQVDAFPNTAPANFGSIRPAIVRTSGTQRGVSWATGGTVTAGNIANTGGSANISLADEVAGAFTIVGGVLDLGAFTLNLSTSGDITLPTDLTRITGTGSITIMGASITSGTQDALTLETSGTLTMGGNFNYHSLTLEGDTLNLTATNRLGSIRFLSNNGVNLTYGTLQGTPSLAAGVLHLRVTTTGTGKRTFDGTAAPWLTNDERNTTINTGGDLELTGTFRVDSANLTFNAGGNGQLIFTGNPIIRADNIVFSQGSTAQYPKAAPADFGRIAVTIDDTHNRVSWASGGGALLGGDVTLTGTGSAINLLDEIAAYYDITNNRLDLGDSNLTVSGNVLTSSAAITSILSTGTISITGGLTASGSLALFADTMELGGTFTTSTGRFQLAGANDGIRISVVADLTFNSPVIMGSETYSLGSAGFNLTLDSIETRWASFVLSGKNITLNGALTTSTSTSITITADNDIAVNDITATNALALTATAGGITFNNNPTITASSITLTQADAFPNTAPANFGSVTPSIARIDDIQAAVDWANVVVIGDITVDAVAANIILADELVTSAFTIDGNGVLDLGTYNLSLTTSGTITLPATLTRITGTGSITIMGSDIGSGTQEVLRLEATGTLTLGGNFNYRDLTLVAGTLNLAAHRLGRIGFGATVTGINLTYGTLQGTPTLSVTTRALTVTTTGTGKETFDGTAAPWLTSDDLNLTINTGGDLELTGSFVTEGGRFAFNAGGNGRIIFTGNPDIRSVSGTTFSQGSTAQYPKAAPADFGRNAVTIDDTHNRVSWASGGGALLGGDVTLTGTGSDINFADEIAAYYGIVGNAVDLGGSNLTVSGNILAPSTITTITTTGTISITDGLTTTAALNLNAGAMVLGGTITAQALTLSSGGSTTGSIAFSTTRATTISATGSLSFEFETAATPSRQPLSITATENLELNGALAMNPGAALNLSFGGTLGGALDLTATNLGITSTGSSAVTLPSWVFGDDTRQLRLDVAAITLVANEEWVAESVTFGKDTTITNTSGFFLNVPTIEAGENTLTINVRQLNFLTGAAATITAGAVSLTAVTVSGEPSDTPSLTITATTGNLTLAGGFSIGAGAMILTATQGEIVFTSNPTLTATSFSLTQGGAAFPAAKPATFSDNAGADVPPTIRYTGGLQPPVDWDDETSAEAITETDGGGYNINTLLSEGGAFAAFETTRGILDLGETDLILETDNNIAIPGRITQIRARNIIIRAGIFGRGTVATPAALNRDIEFVATEGIIFRADIQSGNKITFTGRGIAFNDKKTTRISASEIVIATTGTGFANNQNVFLEATGNITLAGDVNVGLGSLIINAGGSIVTTDTTSLTGNKISYNPAVVVRNANALTLTAYDDIYLPGINLNNGDGALSLTAGGSIVTGSARSILGTTIGFTQGQARYETGRLLLRAFTGALTIDGHIAHDMITLRVSDPALLDLTDAILEGVVIGNTP